MVLVPLLTGPDLEQSQLITQYPDVDCEVFLVNSFHSYYIQITWKACCENYIVALMTKSRVL